MNREVLFAKTLEDVRKLAKEQGNCVSEEQVKEAFAALDLDNDQLQMVFDYLVKHKVGIGQPVDPDEYLMYLPAVIDVAKIYAGQGVLLEDLIGEGNLALAFGTGMLGSLESPAEADGMLGKMIMDAMEDYIQEHTASEKADQKIADKVNKVTEKAKVLSEELHRKVTVEELAEETGMSVQYIEEAVRMSGFQIEYIE